MEGCGRSGLSTDAIPGSQGPALHPQHAQRSVVTLATAGLAWTAIAENPTLVDFFDVLTLSIDRGGRTYVSTMEAIDYPITATQWCAGGGVTGSYGVVEWWAGLPVSRGQHTCPIDWLLFEAHLALTCPLATFPDPQAPGEERIRVDAGQGHST